MRFRVCLLVAAVANLVALSSASAVVITPFVTQSGGTPRNDTYPQAGYGFYTNVSGTVQINQLGYWDEGNNGLAVAHNVGLYNFNGVNSTLIAKAIIPAGTGATLESGYRWASIPTITLTDTQQGADYYQLIASHGTDTWYDGGVVVVTASFGTLTGNGFALGAPMGNVGDTAGLGPTGIPFGGANMGFAEPIPEPSTIALLGIGALLIGRYHWKRRLSRV
jgi:hypothetical protein